MDTIVVGMMENHSFDHSRGKTWRNRNYLHAAQDFGARSNDNSAQDGTKTLNRQFEEAGISRKCYFMDLPFLSTHSEFPTWLLPGRIGTVADYFAEALSGRPPQGAVVDPACFANDDHPPADIQFGQRFMADVYGALVAGPHWHSSAFFLTYHEGGGFFDHVVSPRLPDLRPSSDGLKAMTPPRRCRAQPGRLGLGLTPAALRPAASPGPAAGPAQDRCVGRRPHRPPQPGPRADRGRARSRPALDAAAAGACFTLPTWDRGTGLVTAL